MQTCHRVIKASHATSPDATATLTLSGTSKTKCGVLTDATVSSQLAVGATN